jgi:DNA-binding SARP family transcriptional activator
MLRLFGTPDFQDAPVPLERSTVLVAILVLADDWVSRESLMALLWAGAPLEVTQVRLR